MYSFVRLAFELYLYNSVYMYILDQSMAYDFLSAANSCSHISSDLL